MHFLLNSLLFALDHTRDVFLPDDFLAIFAKEFGLDHVRNLRDFGYNTEFFFEVIKRLDPVLIFLFLVERLICMCDVFKVVDIEVDELGLEGFFFGKGVEFDFCLGFL
jgi:hypothetical protein